MVEIYLTHAFQSILDICYPEWCLLPSVVGGAVKEKGRNCQRRREDRVGKGEKQHCHMHAGLRDPQ